MINAILLDEDMFRAGPRHLFLKSRLGSSISSRFVSFWRDSDIIEMWIRDQRHDVILMDVDSHSEIDFIRKYTQDPIIFVGDGEAPKDFPKEHTFVTLEQFTEIILSAENPEAGLETLLGRKPVQPEILG